MDSASAAFLTVVIPAYNEAPNLQRCVEEALHALKTQLIPSFEIILVNDGSVDGTQEVVKALETGNRCIRSVSHDKNRGLGAAIMTGCRHAKGELICWIPSDGQFDIVELLNGLGKMTACDMVVTIRQGERRTWRSAISWCFHRLTWLLFRFNATDMCGLFIIRKSILEELRPKSQNIFLNLEIPILCLKHHKRVSSHVLTLRPRLGGVSKVANFRTMAKNVVEMFKVRYGG